MAGRSPVAIAVPFVAIAGPETPNVTNGLHCGPFVDLGGGRRAIVTNGAATGSAGSQEAWARRRSPE